jgi:hypothetical protein
MSEPRVEIDPNVVPPEVDRWNWGAFLLNWIWGVGNGTFIALLALVPGIGLIMMVVLGAKGSGWAWRNRRWDSVAHFKRVQRAWATWGLVIWLGAIALFGGIMGSVFYTLSHNDAYVLGIARLQASRAATDALGTPITPGFVNGSISTEGTSGRAALRFSATGPKASGDVALDAVKQGGVWSLTKLTLTVDGRVIDLMQDVKAGIDGGRWGVAARGATAGAVGQLNLIRE